jgi:anthranilate phosphoribosyltransferase
LADPAIGWAYLDQSMYCPKLHRLTPLRSLIVKRPALTTVETLIGPIRARRRTHLVTGYVHKAYPRIYALLARSAKFNSALLVRGVEGGIVPSMRQEGKCFFYKDGGEEQERRIAPAEFGDMLSLMPPSIPAELVRTRSGAQNDEADDVIDTAALAQAAAHAGLQALTGEPGSTRDNLVVAAALCLHHVGRYPSLAAAATAARRVLDDGSARNRLQRFK